MKVTTQQDLRKSRHTGMVPILTTLRKIQSFVVKRDKKTKHRTYSFSNAM